jgi:hypothetical protein
MNIHRRVSIGFCAAAVDAKLFTTILQWPGDSHDRAWVRGRRRDDGKRRFAMSDEAGPVCAIRQM